MICLWRWQAVLWLAVAAVPAVAAAPYADILVHVTKEGPEVVVEVDCPVRAPLSVVWEVLTDFDNMSRFLSNISYSTVRDRAGNALTVQQKGKATYGLLSFAYDNVREVELHPFTEIRSRQISGNLKAFAFTTRLVETNGIVHILNSGRYTPKIWVPPFIGPAVIEGETRKQLGEVRAEILRRSERSPAAPVAP